MATTLGRAEPPAEGEVAQHIARGQQLFSYWCETCHGRGPGHGGTVALDFKYQSSKPAVLEERTDLSQEEVIYYVRNGASIMPFFRKTELSERDLADVAAYLARRH